MHFLAGIALSTLALFAGIGSTHADPTAGPHLTGEEYVALRGGDPAATINFTLVVQSTDETVRRNITVGPDYVWERGPARNAVYDFRFERFLHLNEQDGTFSNGSLFGHFQTRFALLQNNLVTIGSGIAMGLIESRLAPSSRFVVEHTNGIRFPRPVAFENLPEPEFDATRDTDVITGRLSGTKILTVRLGEHALPSERHGKALRAWLAWAGTMHPHIAREITGFGMLPAQVEIEFQEEILKMSPNARPSTRLFFENVTTQDSRFSALGNLQAAPPAWPPHLPASLAKLMVSAARGTAPGGPKPDEEFISEIKRLSASDRHLDAILLGLHASHPYDGCQGNQGTQPVCEALFEAAQKARENQDVRRLFAGFGAGERGNHAQSWQILTPLRDRQLSRPDILEFIIANAVVEAKKASQLDEKLADAFTRLPQTFEQALAADPYDPARYRDIFNFLFAAASNLQEGYQVRTDAQALIDLAQVIPGRRTPLIVSQVAAGNARIASDFPVLFPFTNR